MTTTQGSSSHNDIWLVVQKAGESFRLFIVFFLPLITSECNVSDRMEASLWVTSTSSHDNDFSLLKSHLKQSQNYTRSYNRLYLELFFSFFPPKSKRTVQTISLEGGRGQFYGLNGCSEWFWTGKIETYDNIFKVQQCCASLQLQDVSYLHFANTTSHW